MRADTGFVDDVNANVPLLPPHPDQKKKHESSITSEPSEYARVGTVLVAKSAEFTFYTDQPGKVPSSPSPSTEDFAHDIGNGGLSPQWGVDATVFGAQMNYGAWTSRQRCGCILIALNFLFN
jgi:hypothetical protein